MAINDKLKQKIDELDLDRRLDTAVRQAEAAMAQARDKAAELADERGDDLERLLDKVTTSIDSRTDGRFAAPIGKVRGQVSAGVARLAERHHTDG
jgi:hypothetical protein